MTAVSSTTPVAAPSQNSSQPATRHPTIQDYLNEYGGVETPVHRGEPGVPNIALPFPPDWTSLLL